MSFSRGVVIWRLNGRILLLPLKASQKQGSFAEYFLNFISSGQKFFFFFHTANFISNLVLL